MDPKAILTAAAALIDDRGVNYGGIEACFERAAALATLKLNRTLTAYGATWDDVTGPAHHARTVTMRRAVYWLMHCNGFSLSRIGALTHRDHTSILHGLKKVNSWTPKQS